MAFYGTETTTTTITILRGHLGLWGFYFVMQISHSVLEDKEQNAKTSQLFLMLYHIQQKLTFSFQINVKKHKRV